MFSGQIVKNLLKETGRPTADLSELLYGNRKRSVSNLLGENSNPTAHTRTIIDTQKKLIQEQEERIKNLEKIVALREEEMSLYKRK